MDVFGDCFSSFWDSVSGEFSGEDEFDSWLDFSGRKSSSFIESDEFWTFSGNSVESIMNERVHDVHGFLWDTNVGVHLLKNFVDIDGESLNSSSSCFLVSFGSWSSFLLSGHLCYYYYVGAQFKLKTLLSLIFTIWNLIGYYLILVSKYFVHYYHSTWPNLR